jgi:hypothetical protein
MVIRWQVRARTSWLPGTAAGSSQVSSTTPSTNGTPLVCGLCQECCKGPRELDITEPAWLYSTYTRGGKTYLATRKNGDCVYLDAGGCSIHAQRPQACRAFDCRDYLNDPRLPMRMRVAALRRNPMTQEVD